MEVVDPAKPEVQLGRACSFGPQGWPHFLKGDKEATASNVVNFLVNEVF